MAVPDYQSKRAKDKHWSDVVFARKQRLLAPIRASIQIPGEELMMNQTYEPSHHEQPSDSVRLRATSTPVANAICMKTPPSNQHPYESGLLSQPSHPSQQTSVHLKSKKSSKASILKPEQPQKTIKLRPKQTDPSRKESVKKLPAFPVEKATEDLLKQSSRLVRSISGSLLQKMQATKERESRNSRGKLTGSAEVCEELPRIA